MGGVVMGHDHDGPLGVGRAELGEDVVGAALGKQTAEAALTGRQLVGDQGGRGSAGDGRKGAGEATAAPGGKPSDGAGASEQPDRPPEGAVGPRLLLDPDVAGAGLAELTREPFGGAPLALGRRAALLRAELVEPGTHPGCVRWGSEAGGSISGHAGKLPIGV